MKAVIFDVDFTLIYPGPTFRGEGYRAFCARHGMGYVPIDTGTPMENVVFETLRRRGVVR